MSSSTRLFFDDSSGCERLCTSADGSSQAFGIRRWQRARFSAPRACQPLVLGFVMLRLDLQVSKKESDDGLSPGNLELDFNTRKTNPYGRNMASSMILRLDLRGERPVVV